MVFKPHTHAFLGGLFAQKSVGSFKDLSKLSSTLQHLLTTSDWAIGSGDILVGSCVPSYLKAGCFQSWRGWTRRLTKDKTTWSLVIPLFFQIAMALRMHSTCLPPGPLLDQFSWIWGTPRILSGSGDSKFPTWNQNFFHSAPLPDWSHDKYSFRVSGQSISSHPPTTAGLRAFAMGTRMKKCWKMWKWGRMPRNASQKWVKLERCRMDWGFRWCNWIPQNCKIA